jgi:hypothetical protein
VWWSSQPSGRSSLYAVLPTFSKIRKGP